MRNMTIRKAMNGYIVQVGCQTLVFETRATLLRELGAYLDAPAKVESEYREKYGLTNMVGGFPATSEETPAQPPQTPWTPLLSADPKGMARE